MFILGLLQVTLKISAVSFQDSSFSPRSPSPDRKKDNGFIEEPALASNTNMKQLQLFFFRH